MPKLISSSGHSFELPPPPCRIGTAPNCQIPIQPGLGIAPDHLTIGFEGGRYYIQDGGSGLPTYVNGQPIKRVFLKGGESLRIGQLELHIQLDPPSQVLAQPANSQPAVPMEKAAISQTMAQIVPTPESAFPAPYQFPADFPVPTAEPQPTGQAEPPAPAAEGPTAPDPDPAPPPPPEVVNHRRVIKRRREKPPISLEEEKKKWPALLGGLAALGLVFAALLISQNPEMMNRFIGSSEEAIPRIPERLRDLEATKTATVVEVVGQLANLTRPAAVMSVDLAALKERDFTQGMPRLKRWLQSHAQIDLDAADHLTAVGATTDDFSMALQFADYQDAPLEGRDELKFETLHGPFIAKWIDPRLVVICKESCASGITSPWESFKLTSGLASELAEPEGRIISYLDTSLVEHGNMPFFLGYPGEYLTNKVATLAFGKGAGLRVIADKDSTQAKAYAEAYPAAIRAGLIKLGRDKVDVIERSTSKIKVLTEGNVAEIRWGIPSSKRGIALGLIEMIVDPLGAEIGSASASVLREEAKRVSALYHTAKAAGADVSKVNTVAGALAALEKGVSGTKSHSKDQIFQCRSFTQQERHVLSKFLRFQNGTLHVVEESLERDALEVSYESVNHAEELASLYASAVNAEVDLSAVTDLNSAVTALVQSPGLQGDSPEKRYHYPLPAETISAVFDHLVFNEGQLIYNPNTDASALLQDPRYQEIKPRRDALALASVYGAARAAGAGDLGQIDDLDQALDKLTEVMQGGGDDPLASFSLDLTVEEREAAKAFLRMENREIVLADIEGE